MVSLGSGPQWGRRRGGGKPGMIPGGRAGGGGRHEEVSLGSGSGDKEVGLGWEAEW